MGLLTNRNKPLIASRDLQCYKVFLKVRGKYYTLPSSYNRANITKDPELLKRVGPYETGRLYEIKESGDAEKDYRIYHVKGCAGVIDKGFFHTFFDLEGARKLKDIVLQRGDPEFFKDKYTIKDNRRYRLSDLHSLPKGSEVVILKAIIPKGSLYYKGFYDFFNDNMTLASNKIIYKPDEIKDIRPYKYEFDRADKKFKRVDMKLKTYSAWGKRNRVPEIKGEDTVRVWHTTLVSNLDSIKRYGLLSRYQKDRDFENKSLGLGLMKTPCIYLSKNLEHLCIPAIENKKVVLQIDIPKELYNKWNRSNKGDPMYQYFMSNRNKFRTWKDFIDYMIKEMTKQDPNLKASIEKEISVYGSLENTPRYKHGLNSFDALRPENCLISYDDIKPEWISDEVLTESQLSKMGIYFGR